MIRTVNNRRKREIIMFDNNGEWRVTNIHCIVLNKLKHKLYISKMSIISILCVLALAQNRHRSDNVITWKLIFLLTFCISPGDDNSRAVSRYYITRVLRIENNVFNFIEICN